MAAGLPKGKEHFQLVYYLPQRQIPSNYPSCPIIVSNRTSASNPCSWRKGTKEGSNVKVV
jgi:hypothetical protein